MTVAVAGFPAERLKSVATERVIVRLPWAKSSAIGLTVTVAVELPAGKSRVVGGVP